MLDSSDSDDPDRILTGIKDSFIKFPAESIPEEFHSQKGSSTVNFQLNSSEDLFIELRDRNFNSVCSVSVELQFFPALPLERPGNNSKRDRWNEFTF